MIIDELKEYLAGYSGLQTDAPLWVNYLGVEEVQYSIVPLPGKNIVETNILGIATYEFPFAFQSVESTNEELDRLTSVGFQEAFGNWLDAQTDVGVLPTLTGGKTATKIEAVTWGILARQGESQTGIYQIDCKLTYTEQT